jgi:hypothetical protein
MRHEKLLRSETHDEACLDFERQLREFWMMVLSLMIDSTPSFSDCKLQSDTECNSIRFNRDGVDPPHVLAV